MDIILVDETGRKPLGRPWLTTLLDEYSRMVLGFYLAFEPVGYLAVGQCIAHAILPKEKWLNDLGIEAIWPCHGIPHLIQSDNAKEFESDQLKLACEQYGIGIEYRPVKNPSYGGHIERFGKTINTQLQNLRGATFSNPKEREGYDSEKEASMTIKEFEVWLTEYIVNDYHIRAHRGIKMPPIKKYQMGVTGNESTLGFGTPAFNIEDELRLRIDFLPGELRTIQRQGVVIDHIHYWDGVLLPYLHSSSIGKRKHSDKYLFKRDPRNIKEIYFLDPKLKQYFTIPYKDRAKVPMTIWEWRAAMKEANEHYESLDEDKIYASFKRRKKIEENSIQLTKAVQKKKYNSSRKTVPSEMQEKPKRIEGKYKSSSPPKFNPEDIKHFDDRR